MSVRRIQRIAALVAVACLAVPAGVVAQDDLPATLGASTPAFQDDVNEQGQWGCPTPAAPRPTSARSR